MHVKASRAVFWSLSGYKELKLTTKPFSDHALCCFLIQMQNISLRSLGIWRKQSFEIVVGFESDTAVSTFSFRFLSAPFFYFSCLIFFSFAGHLVDFILLGKVLRLDERKGGWVLEQDFSWEFLGQCYMNFLFFLRPPWLNHAHSGMLWKMSLSCTG